MKNIRWTGKSTDGSSRWTAEGTGYKDLCETLIAKYDDAIVSYDMLDIKKLEINGEDLEAYRVTTDGIGDTEKLEQFQSRTGLRELTEDDYREVITDATGNAYYQTFEEEVTVLFTWKGVVKEKKTGFLEDIADWVEAILENMQSDYDMDLDDLMDDVSQADSVDQLLSLLDEGLGLDAFQYEETGKTR